MNPEILGKYTFLVLVLITFLAACHRDKPQKSKTELLTAAPWKFSRAGLDTNNDGTIDAPLRPDLLNICYTDNMFSFKADSTAVLDEGLNNCIPSRPRLTPFKWYFMKDETEFVTSISLIPAFEGNSRILELTEQTFSLTKPVGIHGFPSYLTYVVVLVH